MKTPVDSARPQRDLSLRVGPKVQAVLSGQGRSGIARGAGQAGREGPGSGRGRGRAQPGCGARPDRAAVARGAALEARPEHARLPQGDHTQEGGGRLDDRWRARPASATIPNLVAALPHSHSPDPGPVVRRVFRGAAVGRTDATEEQADPGLGSRIAGWLEQPRNIQKQLPASGSSRSSAASRRARARRRASACSSPGSWAGWT